MNDMTVQRMENESHRDWIDAIINEAPDLCSDWESTFVAGMEKLIDEGKYLTHNQAAKLEQIYQQRVVERHDGRR